MAQTFKDLVNQLLDEVDEDQVSTVEGTGISSETRRCKSYLNLVYRQLFMLKPDWSWARHKDSFVTVGAQQAYTTGAGADDLDTVTDMEKIHAVWLANEPALELLSYTEAKRKYGEFEGTTTGKPFMAYVLDNSLYLYPTPDQAYTVNYVASKVFLELTTDAQEPYLPDGKRHVLYLGALAHLLRKEGENYSDVFALYQQAIQELRGSEMKNHKGYAIVPEEETVTADYYESILLE